MPEALSKPVRGVTLRLTLECDLSRVRPATLAVREFLSEQGLHEEELAACELALVEACNNAIQYVCEGGKSEPVEITALCNGSKVELVVQDHTPGFNWPEHASLPGNDSERGRGLFLIQSLMDQTRYFRGRGNNALIMRKMRCFESHRPAVKSPEDFDQAKQKLLEAERVISQMAKELCFRSESLSAIFRCSAELGRNNNLEEFAQRLLSDLLHITSADWFILRLVNEQKTSLEIFASSEHFGELPPLPLPVSGQPIRSSEVQAAVGRSEVWFDACKPLPPGDPLRASKTDCNGLVHPLCLGEELIGTLAVGRAGSESALTGAQLEAVRTFSDFLAIQIVNERLREEHVSASLVSRELEIARSIQQALLPKSLPQPEGFSLAGFCESARQVGGDIYDVVQLNKHSFLLLVADVMGSGVPAAMFAAILRNLVHSMLEWTHKPDELLTRLNRMIFDELSQVDMFVTAQIALVDTKKRTVSVASAGHCPLLVGSPTETEVTRVAPEGMPLGILASTTYGEETVKLPRHSRLILYTDGITEARNGQGELWGEERLMRWIRETSPKGASAEELKQSLSEACRQFQGPEPLRDDQSFIVLAENAHRAHSHEHTDPQLDLAPSAT